MVLLNLDGGEHDDEPATSFLPAGGRGSHRVRWSRGRIAAVDEPGQRALPRRGNEDRRAAPVVRRSRRVRPEGHRSLPPMSSRPTSPRSAPSSPRVAKEKGAAVFSAKPHGALYHAGHRDPAVARACVAGIGRALGPVVIVGLAGGALEAEARPRAPGTRTSARRSPDRGRARRRTEPSSRAASRGALLDDPQPKRRHAPARFIAGAATDTLCVHADTPAAVVIARRRPGRPRRGRRRLDRAKTQGPLGPADSVSRMTPFGDRAASGFAIDPSRARRQLVTELLALPGVANVAFSEEAGRLRSSSARTRMSRAPRRR